MVKKTATLAETQEQFKQYYQKNLQKTYEELETKRRKYFKQFLICLLACTVSLLILFEVRGYIGPDAFFRIAGIMLVPLVIAAYLQVKNYRDDTKNNTMNTILSFWGNFTYCNSSSPIHPQDIKRSEIFPYYNHTNVDESFSGIYDGTAINVAEQELCIKGNKIDTSLFKGILIFMDFQKKYGRKTIVINRGRLWYFTRNNFHLIFFLLLSIVPILFAVYMFLQADAAERNSIILHLFIPPLLVIAIFGMIYLIYRNYNPKRANKKVVLEDLSFLRKWNVYTNNQIDARYILTPIFMEKIGEIKRLFHGHAVDFSFFGGKLLIAVYTNKNMFETTSLFRPATDYRLMEDVVKQLCSIFSVVDLINDHKNKTNSNIKAKTKR